MEQINLEKINDFSPNKDEIELLDPVTGEPILPPKDEEVEEWETVGTNPDGTFILRKIEKKPTIQ